MDTGLILRDMVGTKPKKKKNLLPHESRRKVAVHMRQSTATKDLQVNPAADHSINSVYHVV